MKNLAKLLSASLLLASLAAPGLAQWKEGRQFDQVVKTTLTDVRAYPDAYRNVKIEFDIQFAILGNVSNPFFTQFVPVDFANFHAWGAEQSIWRKTDFDNMFGLLFISKSSEQLELLYNSKTFDRMRVTALVRNTFQGQPWIEVTEFEMLEEKVDWATLSHLYRADQAIEKRSWKRALAELSLASQSGNPLDVRFEIAKTMGSCHLKLGEAALAKQRLSEARDIVGERVDAEVEGMLRVAMENPTAAIDNAVDENTLRASERPLWEAFEKDDPAVTPSSPPPVPGR